MAAMGTQESLKSDVDDEYSLIVTCHETVHVPLPPAYIGSEGRGIKTLLESWKGQYVERLHGVLLGYENLKFVEASGTIIDDQPFVHQDVVGDFQVFRPETGSIVRAHINRMSKNHVGCLVHNWINLSILLPPNPSPELSRYLNMGQEILCKITSVSVYRHNALKLRGSITSECLKLMGDTIPLIQTSYDEELVEYESNFGDDWNDNCGSDAEVGAQSELCYLEPDEDFSMRPRGQLLPEDGSLTSMEPPQVLQSPEKPKKKRKSVGKEMQASVHASQSSDAPVSQDSEFSAPALSDSGKTKAKKKKRKREDDGDDGAPTAKKRKEEKKKRGQEMNERKKEKRQKKEKTLKMDTEDNASSTVSYSSDRLSASESAFIKDIIKKKKKKEKMPKVDIENFGSSTASFCSDHLSAAETASIPGTDKKKKKTLKMEVEDIASSTASFCSDRLSTAETASIQDIAEPITIEHELTVSPTKHKKKHKKSKKENGPSCDAGVDSVCSDVSLKVKKKKKKKDKMEH
ncbi:DNA-directed RNA polymerase I subunit RPA43-like [Dermacentor silvarum]|uniref:DNA-directed RNA polymerase I subunit RPA43-like n=1 Tax=Dermacentor silvarum TaxID=543639 RepID=UPI00189AEE77|nr:DNA-directed RNA polymerase I subunit RPA43-like [Dermacentor silvarum]